MKNNGRWLPRLLVTAGFTIAAFAIAAVILAVMNANVLDAFRVIFLYPFSSMKTISGAINVMTPLAIIGIGICAAYRGGFVNIGGEGQMTMGILLSLIVGLQTTDWPRGLALLAVLLAGMIGGGLWVLWRAF